MGTTSLFLRKPLDVGKEKYGLTAEKLSAILRQSPVFVDSRLPTIDGALEHYLAGDFVSFAHLIIPQIESAVRTLVETCGGVVVQVRRDGGGYNYVQLDGLLRSPVVSTVLSEDTVFYIRSLLTDHRGWNVRNEVCHGLLPHSRFDRMIADRLLHVVFLLAQVRNKTKAEAGPQLDRLGLTGKLKALVRRIVEFLKRLVGR